MPVLHLPCRPQPYPRGAVRSLDGVHDARSRGRFEKERLQRERPGRGSGETYPAVVKVNTIPEAPFGCDHPSPMWGWDPPMPVIPSLIMPPVAH